MDQKSHGILLAQALVGQGTNVVRRGTTTTATTITTCRFYRTCTRVQSLNHSNPAIYSSINVSLTSVSPIVRLGSGKENPTSNQTTKDSTATRGARGDDEATNVAVQPCCGGIHDYRKRSRNLGAIIHPLPPLPLSSVVGGGPVRHRCPRTDLGRKDHGIVERLMLA